jgi:hypothetical protein
LPKFFTIHFRRPDYAVKFAKHLVNPRLELLPDGLPCEDHGAT